MPVTTTDGHWHDASPACRRSSCSPYSITSGMSREILAGPRSAPLSYRWPISRPTLNVGMLGGGTVVNAIPREAWFTVDLRSLDGATQDRLESTVVSTARRVAEQEGVGFRM